MFRSITMLCLCTGIFPPSAMKMMCPPFDVSFDKDAVSVYRDFYLCHENDVSAV